MADDTISKPKRKLPAKETKCPYCDHITTAAGIYLHVKVHHDEKFAEYKAAHPTNPANERRRQEQKARKLGQQPAPQPQAAPPRSPAPAPAGDAKPQSAQSFPAAAPKPAPAPRAEPAKPAEQPKKAWYDRDIF